MRNLILTLNILSLVALLGCATPAPAPVAAAKVSHVGEPSWCVQWNTFGDVDGGEAVTMNQRFMFHLGFFLSKKEALAGMIQHTHPTFDEATMAKIMTCYEENTPALVDQLDKVCSTNSNKQDEQVDQSLETYIDWCIKQSTTRA